MTKEKKSVARGLDHIVHAVRDLDAASSFYERLGFTVGARNVHPWGTSNRLVQLPGFFIEIIAIADNAALDAAAHDGGIGELFGVGIRNWLAREEGFAFLMLESTDATADAAAFAANGIARSNPLHFTRAGKTPDGDNVTVGFSLVFAGDTIPAEVGFAVCQQHNPSAFWNASFQRHANGARDVAGVMLVADNPADHHIFLEAFTSVRAPQSTSLGLTARTPRGELEIAEAPFIADAYGVELKGAEGLRLAAVRIAVDDLDRTETLVRSGSAACERRQAGLVVGPEAAFGATLIFEQAAVHKKG